VTQLAMVASSAINQYRPIGQRLGFIMSQGSSLDSLTRCSHNMSQFTMAATNYSAFQLR